MLTNSGKDIDSQFLDKIKKYFTSFSNVLINTKYGLWGKFFDDYRKDEDTVKYFIKLFYLVKQIRYILGIKNLNKIKLGHYTKINVLKDILTPELDTDKNQLQLDSNNKIIISGRYRFNNVDYMNDPEEGVVFYSVLDQELNKEEILDIKPWYILCLTNQSDSLPMWSQYGEKAEGVFLGISNHGLTPVSDMKDVFFSNENDVKISKINDKERGKKEKLAYRSPYNMMNPYRICYLQKTMKENGSKDFELSGSLFSDEELKEIKDKLKELNNIINSLTEKGVNKSYLIDILEELSYLFKNADYEYESEVRLINYVKNSPNNGIELNSKSGFPTLYVESQKTMDIEEIIFGPKVNKVQNYIPFIKYINSDIELKKSNISFR